MNRVRDFLVVYCPLAFCQAWKRPLSMKWHLTSWICAACACFGSRCHIGQPCKWLWMRLILKRLFAHQKPKKTLFIGIWECVVFWIELKCHHSWQVGYFYTWSLGCMTTNIFGAVVCVCVCMHEVCVLWGFCDLSLHQMGRSSCPMAMSVPRLGSNAKWTTAPSACIAHLFTSWWSHHAPEWPPAHFTH